MRIGFIGLGKMGKNMVLNLLDKKHKVVVFNRSPEPVWEMEKKGAIGADSIKDMVSKLPKRKIIWLMISAGKPVDFIITELVRHLNKSDIIIDGGNSYYKDSIRRYQRLKKKGIDFLDCGTSGGISGARHGACMMIGGEPNVFKKVQVLFKDMCVKNGYGYMGKQGSGHYVKMVHNAIEYGMMGAIAEGIDTIRKQSKKFNTDLLEVAKVYANGSIIDGKLMDWLLSGMKSSGFKSISGEVPKGATEDEMTELEKSSFMPILHQARLMRINSRNKPNFRGKLIATLRNQFGGHAVKKK